MQSAILSKVETILSELDHLETLTKDPQIPESTRQALVERIARVAGLCAGIANEVAADK
jgi:hypothetical protein